ncbi:MAG: hypothetical protein ACQEUM_17910 [Pseudomonadota bacterium]
MPFFEDYEIEWLADDLDEHARTLQALGQRLEADDADASHTSQGIAHELWEMRKTLLDDRRARRESSPSGRAD